MSNRIFLEQIDQSGASSNYVIAWNGTSWAPAVSGVADGDKGDITISGGVWTLDSAVVSLAKMANLAANSIIGNNTGSAATPIALTVAETKTLLALNNVDNTSDASKPVSTAQAAADALKANLAGGNAFSGDQTVAGELTITSARTTGNNPQILFNVEKQSSNAGVFGFRRSANTNQVLVAFETGSASNPDGYFGTVPGVEDRIYFMSNVGGSGTFAIDPSGLMVGNGIFTGAFSTAPATISAAGAITGASLVTTGTVTGSNLSGTHAGTSSGTNTGDQTITLTGNVTGSGTGSFATTIANNVVTNAMLAQIGTATFQGRASAGTGNVETLSATQATALLDAFTSGAKGLAPASGGGTTNFLRADGTWAAAGSSTFQALTDAVDYVVGDANKVVQVNSGGTGITYGVVLGTAASQNTGAFATASHTHAIADVTGLQTALDSKVDDSQISAFALTLLDDTTDAAFRTTLGLGTAATSNTGDFAPTVHTHTIADVTGLATALSGKEPTITASTTADYWRGDKTFQTLNKAAVGLANVDNTSDASKPVSTATQTALDLKAPLANPTFTGTVTLAGDPTLALQAATKQYVDGVAQGLDIKPSVLVASTTALTLSGEQTIDGFLTSASRVLVMGQTLTQDNGIYVTAAGAWTRASDMDSWGEVPGAFVFVEKGTVYGDTGWVSTADQGGTINTTPITWTQFAGAGEYTASGGITKTGINFALSNMAANSIKGNNTGGAAAPTDLTGAQVTALLSAFVGDSGSGGTKGLVPAPTTGDASKFLKGDGSWATVAPLTDGDKGDITVTASGATWTIDANAVTLSKLAQVATATFLGRTSASTGNVEALTSAQATALLSVFGTSANGLVPAPGSTLGKYLKDDGTWANPASGDPGWTPINATGTGASQNITLPSTVTENDVFVFVNGLRQEPYTDYTISGTTLTLTTPLSTDSISVVRPGTGIQGPAGGGGVWGTITGTLASQTDLSTALAGKASTGANSFTAAQSVTGNISATGTVTGSNLSGSNSGDQTIILTGNVTGSGTGSFATAIASNAVTNAMLAQVPTATFKGRTSASTGAVEDMTATEATALLNLVIASGAKGLMSGSDKTKLDGVATGATANTGTVTGVTLTQPANGITLTNSGTNQTTAVSSTIALANDLGALEGLSGTGIARRTGADAWSVGTAVALTEIATQATNTFVANATAGTAAPTAITGTAATTLLDVFTSALKGLVPASGGGTTNFLRADGTWAATTIANNSVTDAMLTQVATGTFKGRVSASTGNVEVLTGTQATTLLDLVVAAGAKGLMSGSDKTKLDGVATGATANTGTVTAVSVATANGVSGSSSGGATPALTIALGAITPSSVAASGTVTGTNIVLGFNIGCSGKPDNAEVWAAGIAPYAYTIVQASCVAKATVAATASTVFTIKKDGTTVGTVTFDAAATTGTFSISSGAITAGQHLTIECPATADTTLANISMLIRA